MGRSYLSVKLAVVFAVAMALVVVMTAQVGGPGWRDASVPGADRMAAPAAVREQRAAPAVACDPVPAARLTSLNGARRPLEVALTPPEVLDSLPMWRGSRRPDCRSRTT